MDKEKRREDKKKRKEKRRNREKGVGWIVSAEFMWRRVRIEWCMYSEGVKSRARPIKCGNFTLPPQQ